MEDVYTPGEIAGMINNSMVYYSNFVENAINFENFKKHYESGDKLKKVMIEVAKSHIQSDKDVLEAFKECIPESIFKKTHLEENIIKHIMRIEEYISNIKKEDKR
jgi:N-glycosylase/DNA lyase